MTISFGSVCSGIESASVALEPIGFKACWFSEIEPFPCAVLAYHWPKTPNLGDMNKLPKMIRCGDIKAPEILIGGTPCQAFSVAGKQMSLKDMRGQLSLIYGDLLNAIDEQRGVGDEAICVWENVPGVLSTRDNAFGWLLGLLAGEYALVDCLSGRAEPLEAQPGESRQKWPKSGCIIGPVRTVAWRVIDAQYFGLAQRRKRVFVVASARKGFDPAEVLFERDGVRRDTPPSREAKQDITRELRKSSQIIARTLLAKSNDSMAEDLDTYVIENHTQLPRVMLTHPPQVGNTLTARMSKGVNSDLNEGQSLVVYAIHDKATRCNGGGSTRKEDGAGNGLGVSQPNDPMYTLTCGDRHAISYPAIRRLTPIECERLQGFPDNHTLLPFGKKQRIDNELKAYYEQHLKRSLAINEYQELTSDGPRYKAIGNSKAIDCVKWLGIRIRKQLEKSKQVTTMNNYATALKETQGKTCHKLKEIGDQWQTPKAIAWGLFSVFSHRLGGFVIDIFADDCNHLLPNYYTAKQNALSQNLAADIKKLGGSAAFGNPPYSRPCFDDEDNAITGMENIINWCREQHEEGAKIMLLIKAATSETWWPEDADFIQFIAGRIKFEAPDWFQPETDRDKPSSSGFASAVVIFDKAWQWEARPKERLYRDDLIASGNVILQMMENNKEAA